MKKRFLFTVLILSICGSFAKTKNIINQTIISVHTRVFGKDNLFKSRIDYGDSKAWNDMVSAVSNFVKTNRADSKILDALNKTTDLANELLNTNKIIYSSIFSSGSPSKATVLSTTKKLNDLQKKKTALVKISDALKKRRFHRKKKNAVEILNNLILVLELTTNKLIKDFNKDLARIVIR